MCRCKIAEISNVAVTLEFVSDGEKSQNSVSIFFFFKQKTAYEIKECDWSSDVCSSDLLHDVTFMPPDNACRYHNSAIVTFISLCGNIQSPLIRMRSLCRAL